MSKSDFLSWDDGDIDLDFLLGEYTDDDHIADDSDVDYDNDEFIPERTQMKKVPGPENIGEENAPPTKMRKVSKNESSSLFKCPECHKCLKTISGFRGHVMKKHNLSQIKASDHRISQDTDETPSSDKHKFSTFPDKDNFDKLFITSYDAALVKMKSDPMATAFASDEHFKIVDFAKTNHSFRSMLCTKYVDIFHLSCVNLSVTSDREQLFKEFHKIRLDKNLTETTVEVFSEVCSDKTEIINFLQWFLLDLLNELLVQQLKFEQKTSNDNHCEISDNDQKILFYICGFIIRSCKKRYFKSKSANKEEKLELMAKLVQQTGSGDSFVKKYSAWFEKKDRGGLLKPCDSFFLLVRELESVMRRKVNTDQLTAKSLVVTTLKESMLESFMVKYYTSQLFSGDIAQHLVLSVIEDIISLFLTVRGHAISRLERNKLYKVAAKEKKALRESLKAKSNTK